jgi:hypothetical protein
MPRKIDSCRLKASKLPVDWNPPLVGIIGPTGWLKTVYIDDKMRVTRGPKDRCLFCSAQAKKRTYLPETSDLILFSSF